MTNAEINAIAAGAKEILNQYGKDALITALNKMKISGAISADDVVKLYYKIFD